MKSIERIKLANKCIYKNSIYGPYFRPNDFPWDNMNKMVDDLRDVGYLMCVDFNKYITNNRYDVIHRALQVAESNYNEDYAI